MKKIMSLSMVFIFLFCTSSANNYETVEDYSVNIIINSEKIELASPAIFSNSVMLFPLRELLTQLNIKEENIVWDSKTSSVLLISDKNTLVIKINSEKALMNNITFNLPASPILYKNQTYVPLRLFGEFFNCHIVWDSRTRSVFIKEIDNYFETIKLIKSVNQSISRKKFAQIDIITECKTENNFSFGTSIYLDLEKNKLYEKSMFDKEWTVSNVTFATDCSLFEGEFSNILPSAMSIDMKLTDENHLVLTGFYPAKSSLLCHGKLYLDAKTLNPIKLISETENTKKSILYSFNDQRGRA